MIGMALMCTADMLHPYECGGGCIHCRQVLDDSHDPLLCALCHWDDDEERAELRAHLAAAVADRIRLTAAVGAFRAWLARKDPANGRALAELDRLTTAAV